MISFETPPIWLLGHAVLSFKSCFQHFKIDSPTWRSTGNRKNPKKKQPKNITFARVKHQPLRLNQSDFGNRAHLCDTVPHGRRALLASGGGGHGGGCLHDCGGHVGQRGGGGGVGGQHRGYVTHQPQVALGLDIGVALRCQLEHLQAVVVEARDLALEVASLLATSPDFDERLAVEDGQLATW